MRSGLALGTFIRSRRAYGPSDSSFTPPSLVERFDPALGVASSSGAVSAWTGRNGNVATQPTAANQPMATGTLNGQPTFLYDGTNDYLQCNALASVFSGTAKPWTTYAVVRMTGSMVNYRMWMDCVNSSTSRYYHFLVGSTGAASLWRQNDGGAGSFTLSGAGVIALNVPYVLSSVFTGAVLNLYKNGGLVYSSGALSGAITLNTFAIGGQFGGNPWRGDIGQIDICAAAHSDTERNAEEAYLKTKYGIP